MDEQKKNKHDYTTKRCPECFTYLTVDAKVCSSCKKKVGPVNKHGIAKKPFDWLTYTICLIAWLGFGFYIWWYFFKS